MKSLESIVENCKKYNLQILSDIFHLRKPKDYKNFLEFLALENIIEDEEYSEIVGQSRYTYTFDSASGINFTILNWDSIEWGNSGIHISRERGGYKEIISNKQLYMMQDYINKEWKEFRKDKVTENNL